MCFKKDLEYGLSQEDNILEDLNKFFDCKFKKGKKYKRYDFKSGRIYIELKSRRINHNKYNTTFICKSKLLEAEKQHRRGNKFYFVFNYNDCIRYINYETHRDYLLSLSIRKVKIYRGDTIDNLEIEISKLSNLN